MHGGIEGPWPLGLNLSFSNSLRKANCKTKLRKLREKLPSRAGRRMKLDKTLVQKNLFPNFHLLQGKATGSIRRLCAGDTHCRSQETLAAIELFTLTSGWRKRNLPALIFLSEKTLHLYGCIFMGAYLCLRFELQVCRLIEMVIKGIWSEAVQNISVKDKELHWQGRKKKTYPDQSQAGVLIYLLALQAICSSVTTLGENSWFFQRCSRLEQCSSPQSPQCSVLSFILCGYRVEMYLRFCAVTIHFIALRNHWFSSRNLTLDWQI